MCCWNIWLNRWRMSCPMLTPHLRSLKEWLARSRTLFSRPRSGNGWRSNITFLERCGISSAQNRPMSPTYGCSFHYRTNLPEKWLWIKIWLISVELCQISLYWCFSCLVMVRCLPSWNIFTKATLQFIISNKLDKQMLQNSILCFAFVNSVLTVAFLFWH